MTKKLSKRNTVAASLLACDFGKLGIEAQKMVHDNNVDWIHLDIMDGNFVPNISFGPDVVKCLREYLPKTFFDVHLMVADPDFFVNPFLEAGADMITFHIESFKDLKHGEKEKSIIDCAKHIKECGMYCGVAINPYTCMTELDPLLKVAGTAESDHLIDLVLVMSVVPGFGGQKFMPDTLEKVTAIKKAYPHLNISMDGGINDETAPIAAKAGVNVLVAGSGLFKSPNPAKSVETWKKCIQAATT